MEWTLGSGSLPTQPSPGGNLNPRSSDILKIPSEAPNPYPNPWCIGLPKTQRIQKPLPNQRHMFLLFCTYNKELTLNSDSPPTLPTPRGSWTPRNSDTPGYQNYRIREKAESPGALKKPGSQDYRFTARPVSTTDNHMAKSKNKNISNKKTILLGNTKTQIHHHHSKPWILLRLGAPV